MLREGTLIYNEDFNTDQEMLDFADPLLFKFHRNNVKYILS